MSVVQRLKSINLLVETFLAERNLHAHINEWRNLSIQEQVLREVVCLCALHQQLPVSHPTLTVTSGDNSMVVPADAESVYFGSAVEQLQVQEKAFRVESIFRHDIGIQDLHLVLKKHTPRRYMLVVFAPSNTWVQVQQTVILQPSSVFCVQGLIFQVLECPVVRKRHRHLPTASTVIHVPPFPDESSEVEMEYVQQTVFKLRWVSDVVTPNSEQLWAFRYSLDKSVISIGSSLTSVVQVPYLTPDLELFIECRMNYFWLVPKSTHPVYYHVCPTSKMISVTPANSPLHLKLGDTSHVTLNVSS